LDKAEDEIATLLTYWAKGNHRYKDKTGNLTRHTSFRKMANDIVKGYNDAYYAEYIINSRRTWPGDDFIADAVKDNWKKIEGIIIKNIKKELQI